MLIKREVEEIALAPCAHGAGGKRGNTPRNPDPLRLRGRQRSTSWLSSVKSDEPGKREPGNCRRNPPLEMLGKRLKRALPASDVRVRKPYRASMVTHQGRVRFMRTGKALSSIARARSVSIAGYTPMTLSSATSGATPM